MNKKRLGALAIAGALLATMAMPMTANAAIDPKITFDFATSFSLEVDATDSKTGKLTIADGSTAAGDVGYFFDVTSGVADAKINMTLKQGTDSRDVNITLDGTGKGSKKAGGAGVALVANTSGADVVYPFELSFKADKVGTYKISVSLTKLGDSADVIATAGTITVEVKAKPVDTGSGPIYVPPVVTTSADPSATPAPTAAPTAEPGTVKPLGIRVYPAAERVESNRIDKIVIKPGTSATTLWYAVFGTDNKVYDNQKLRIEASSGLTARAYGSNRRMMFYAPKVGNYTIKLISSEDGTVVKTFRVYAR